jgi:predicted nucleic acid-binding Zn ribbon protein
VADQDPGGPDLAAISLSRARASRRAQPQRRTTPRSSGSGPDERDPQLLSSALDRLLVERGWEQAVAGGSLESRWLEIVGPDVAAHVVCESFTVGDGDQAGELVLRADSTAWATQMRLLQGQVHSRIEDAIGRGVVGRIRILGPSAPSWRAGQRRVPGRGPRDTYG